MDNMDLTNLNRDFVWVETTVIPEILSFIITPIFMIATLLASVRKRKRSVQGHCSL
jgi:hypothetical protein